MLGCGRCRCWMVRRAGGRSGAAAGRKSGDGSYEPGVQSGAFLVKKQGVTGVQCSAAAAQAPIACLLLFASIASPRTSSRGVNAELVRLYWRIGQRICRHILQEKRAEYGQEIVAALSQQLGWSHFVELARPRSACARVLDTVAGHRRGQGRRRAGAGGAARPMRRPAGAVHQRRLNCCGCAQPGRVGGNDPQPCGHC